MSESATIRHPIIAKKAFRKYEYANSDAILEMTDMRVRKGNRVDEIVLNLEAAGYLQSIFEKLREKNRTNYEIYVSVTLMT